MPLAIRPAHATDAAALSRLMVAAILHNNAADYPPEIVASIVGWHTPAAVEAMIGTRRVFVLKDPEEGDGRVIGTVALEAHVMRGLFVAVERQGRGLAVALVRHIEALAVADDIAVLGLQSSLTAHGFYERLGYRTQAFRFHPEGSTYRMVKRLSSRRVTPLR